jgi:hypothetical protein
VTSATATTRPLRRAAPTQALRRLLRTSLAASTATHRVTAHPRASTVVLRVATANHNTRVLTKLLAASTVATSTAATSTAATSTATTNTVAPDPSSIRSPASTARRLAMVDSRSTATASRALADTELKVCCAAALYCSPLFAIYIQRY